MKVRIFGETSQILTQAFLKRGHDAWSLDFLDTEGDRRRHIKGDFFHHVDEGWNLGIFHPSCTFLTVSNTYLKRGCSKYTAHEAEKFQLQAKLDFIRCAESAIPGIVLENPIGVMSTYWRKPDQIIQPYQFGEDASKATCLWLINVPLLVPTLYIEPRMVGDKKRWGNQTDSGQNRLGPSDTRWKERSRTYQGIADAIADQWGNSQIFKS